MLRLKDVRECFFHIQQEVVESFRFRTLLERGLFALLIILCVLMSNHLWNGDLLFHTDLARDFLVLEDIVATKKPTLLGPRSGGIPGVFHGPMWYYVSLIPFILTQGNPVLMGWFWWGLACVATLVFFLSVRYFTKNIRVSLLVSICFALVLIPSAASPVNNFVADLFGFVVFLCWWQWWRLPRLATAVLGWFGLGVLVQFQMAFAVPIALVWGLFFLWKVVQNRLWLQLLSVLLFFPPLASFLLFEIRHDWLQIRSVLQYVQSSSGEGSFLPRVADRLWLASNAGINVFFLPKFLSAVVAVILGFLGWRTGKKDVRSLLGIFSLWYVGWWILTLVFSGTVWGYYFSPFLAILLFVIAVVAARSRAALIILLASTCVLVFQSRSILSYSPERFNGSSWKLLQQIAAESLTQSGSGYFLYSQDQYAYSLKYAFSWVAKQHPETPVFPFVKKEHIVVVKAADDPNNPYLSSGAWLRDSIRIEQNPDSVVTYPFGYQGERYTLTPEEQAIPINPNLILDLHFR